MAVVNTKSSAVTNGDASPRVLNSARVASGAVREHVGTIEAANGDSIGSTFRFARIRSSDRVTSVQVYCDAVTSGAMDVGIYRTAADGGAVVDADLFASAQSIATAITTGTDITHESGVYGVEDIEQPVWQALGLTSDPGVLYDVVGTLTAATTAAGTVSLKVRVVNDN